MKKATHIIHAGGLLPPSFGPMRTFCASPAASCTHGAEAPGHATQVRRHAAQRLGRGRRPAVERTGRAGADPRGGGFLPGERREVDRARATWSEIRQLRRLAPCGHGGRVRYAVRAEVTRLPKTAAAPGVNTCPRGLLRNQHATAENSTRRAYWQKVWQVGCCRHRRRQRPNADAGCVRLRNFKGNE